VSTFEGEQLGLPGIPAPAAEQWRDHTSERWKERAPESYAECVEDIKQGHLNVSALSRKFGRSKQTIRALRNAEFSVEQLEAIIAKKALMVVADALDKQADVISEAGPRDLGALAMVSKAGLEASKLARGQNLHLHEHLHVHVDAATAAERLKEKARKMDLEAGKNLALPTGLEAGGNGGLVLDLVQDAGAGVAVVAVDNKSAVKVTYYTGDQQEISNGGTLGDTDVDQGVGNFEGAGGGIAPPARPDA
jgi:transposase-like protein